MAKELIVSTCFGTEVKQCGKRVDSVNLFWNSSCRRVESSQLQLTEYDELSSEHISCMCTWPNSRLKISPAPKM